MARAKELYEQRHGKPFNDLDAEFNNGFIVINLATWRTQEAKIEDEIKFWIKMVKNIPSTFLPMWP